jgi:hypothetical protein
MAQGPKKGCKKQKISKKSKTTAPPLHSGGSRGGKQDEKAKRGQNLGFNLVSRYFCKTRVLRHFDQKRPFLKRGFPGIRYSREGPIKGN